MSAENIKHYAVALRALDRLNEPPHKLFVKRIHRLLENEISEEEDAWAKRNTHNENPF